MKENLKSTGIGNNKRSQIHQPKPTWSKELYKETPFPPASHGDPGNVSRALPGAPPRASGGRQHVGRHDPTVDRDCTQWCQWTLRLDRTWWLVACVLSVFPTKFYHLTLLVYKPGVSYPLFIKPVSIVLCHLWPRDSWQVHLFLPLTHCKILESHLPYSYIHFSKYKNHGVLQIIP